jgi:hypothetical protein
MSILERAEHIDGFQELCKRNEVNRLARTKCSYTTWNDQSLAEKAKAFLPLMQSIGGGEDLSVVILNPSAEGGMPHTRAPAVICLPAYFSEARLPDTLKHELVHISQRRIPEVWETRARMEGWVRISESVIPDNWLRRCRLNPDTAAARFFAWEGRHVPLPLFVREDKPDLRETVVRWYDMREGRVKSAVPPSFSKKYGGNLSSSAMEHPYELWAYA